MKQLLIGLLLSGTMLFTAGQVQAVTIVDTGAGPAVTVGGFGWSLDNQNPQSLAAKFSLTNAYALTSIDGWMRTYNDQSGTVAISIYGDAGQVPDALDKKYTQNLSVTNSTASWQGVSGLNWNLLAGSYWVAFEVPENSSFYGQMDNPSPFPLGDEAFSTSAGWSDYDGLDLGIRIAGDLLPPTPAAVPEPSTMILLGIGGLGMMAMKRNRKHV